MSAGMSRGACPSLSAPMQTGDGLLVRLSADDRLLSPHQLAGIAAAAQRHGNGMLEVTRRGNLQIRGLKEHSVQEFADEIIALNIAMPSGIPVEVGPLAGIDAQEIADPRPLQQAIRAGSAGLAKKLAPKVSVTVDGGGELHLGALLADVKLTAIDSHLWRVAIGGNAASAREIGVFSAEEAVENTVFILEELARNGRMARARDLDMGKAFPRSDSEAVQPRPVGGFALKDGGIAQGFALGFGQIDGELLGKFVQMLDREMVHLAPGGGLIVTGTRSEKTGLLSALGEELGLVTRKDDPRLAVIACAGAPSCMSSWLATRALAADIAAHLPRGQLIHLSGCAKACARPSAASLTLTGTPQGCVADGAGPLADRLLRLAENHFVERKFHDHP